MDTASVNFETLVPFALFGTVAALAWLALDYFTTGRSRASERLDDFKDPKRRKREGSPATGGSGKRFESMTKVLQKASHAASPLKPKNEQDANKVKSKLLHAGFRGESNTSIFLGLKFIGLVVGFVLSGGVAMLTTGITKNSMLMAGSVTGLMFYLPDLVVWFVGKRRKEAIFLGLPDALDLLVVCVEAGLGLDQGMRKVAEELKETCPVISDELQLTNFQTQMGAVRADALRELGDRTGVEDVRALCNILIQAEKFGSSIAQALRVQSDSMRTRRRQLAEEKAAKTAVKLIFPLVLFIFPGIFVVLVGPAAIIIVRDMFPMMNGSK
ncbi:MAG: type II secretion system F family protein [Pirellulales bacterium]